MVTKKKGETASERGTKASQWKNLLTESQERGTGGSYPIHKGGDRARLPYHVEGARKKKKGRRCPKKKLLFRAQEHEKGFRTRKEGRIPLGRGGSQSEGRVGCNLQREFIKRKRSGGRKDTSIDWESIFFSGEKRGLRTRLKEAAKTPD